MKNGRRKVSRVRFKTRERKKKLRESSVKNTTLEKIKKQFQTKKKFKLMFSLHFLYHFEN